MIELHVNDDSGRVVAKGYLRPDGMCAWKALPSVDLKAVADTVMAGMRRWLRDNGHGTEPRPRPQRQSGRRLRPASSTARTA